MKRVRVSSATRKGGLSLFSVFTHRLTVQCPPNFTLSNDKKHLWSDYFDLLDKYGNCGCSMKIYTSIRWGPSEEMRGNQL